MSKTNKINANLSSDTLPPPLGRESSEYLPPVASSRKRYNTPKLEVEVPMSPPSSKWSGNRTSSSSTSTTSSDDVITHITRFVGPDGLIRTDAVLEGYAELMLHEINTTQRILLLKIIIATLNSRPEYSKRISECEGILTSIGTWLSLIDPDNFLDSSIIQKILEIFSRLHFTIDQLVKYKFGRVVKKIVVQGEKVNKTRSTVLAKNITELAGRIFESWNQLANQSDDIQVPKRKSTPPESVSISIDTLQTNDHQVESTIIIQEDFRVDRLKKSRRVSFPQDEENLHKIIYFHRGPEEYEYLSDGSASRDNYLHADMGEATRAFSLGSLDDDDLKYWTTPQALTVNLPPTPDGSDCEEKIIQHQRERTVLSYSYFSDQEIPSCPSEVDVDTLAYQMNVKNIPIREAEPIWKHQIPIRLFVMPSFVFPIPGIMGFNALTPPPPPPSGGMNVFSFERSAPTATLATDNPWMVPTNSGYAYSAMNRDSSNNTMNDTHKPFTRDDEDYVPPPDKKRVKACINNYRPDSHHQSEPFHKKRDNNKSKPHCRYYRAGKPNSCNSGSSCRFVHQD